jgi:uncharacterized protein (TIGR02588 family)
MDGPGQGEAALEDTLRAIGGGLVFGVPLLYTMEVWSLGRTTQAQHALVALVVTFVPVFLLVGSSGFRKRPDLTRLDVLVDVVTVVGLSLVSVAAVLLILQRITLTTPLPVATRPATFRTQVKPVHPLDGRYRVPADVENVGNQAAADVLVTAELKIANEVIQADETIPFLAPGENTTVTFVFAGDPRKGNFSISVSAYREPS